MNMQKLLEEIDEILDEDQALIYEEYHGKSDQILIDSKLVKRILKHIANYTSNKEQQNSLLKSIIRELFELEDQDLLIIKKGHIFIKLVTTLEQNIPQGRESAQQARYNGYDEEELIDFYNEFCDEQKLQEHIKNVAKRFVSNYIIKRSLSNDEYEKKVFAIIKKLYFDFLTKEYEEEDEFLLGFAGYLFRQNFEKTFMYIAEELLIHLAHNESNVIRFLDYYSQNIVIVNAQKYKVPSIQTAGGHIWKIASMHSVIKVYITAKEMIATLTKKLSIIEKNIKSLIKLTKSPVEIQKNIKNEIIRLNNIINEKSKKIERLQEQLLHIKKSDKQRQIKQEIASLNKEIIQLQEEKKEFEKKLPSEQTITKYQKLQREKETLLKELNNKKMLIEKNRDNYESLKMALVKALLQKKQKI